MRYLQDIYKASKPVEGAEEWDEVGKERSQTSPRIWSTSREALKHMWPFTLAPLLAKAPRLLYSQDDQSLHVGFFMKNMHVKEFAAVDAHSKGPESLFAEYMPSNTHFYVHTHTHARTFKLWLLSGPGNNISKTMSTPKYHPPQRIQGFLEYWLWKTVQYWKKFGGFERLDI